MWSCRFKKIARLEKCTLWSTIKFQRCSLRKITGDNISGATKGVTNATRVYKVIVAIMPTEVIVAIM
jgi:hypothetical protein